jgi:hypothetical protein
MENSRVLAADHFRVNFNANDHFGKKFESEMIGIDNSNKLATINHFTKNCDAQRISSKKSRMESSHVEKCDKGELCDSQNFG